MGNRSLEWNWAKEALNIPILAETVDGAKMFTFSDFLVVVSNELW